MDVTARKEAEIEREALYAEERRLRERAEAADRAKDDFLALVSHELRTPLNAIVAWLHILETTPEPDAATLAKATAFLKRSVDQQRRLIEDPLDTARIASGKLQLEVRALDPAAVAEATLEVVRSAAEARGSRFTPSSTRMWDPSRVTPGAYSRSCGICSPMQSS